MNIVSLNPSETRIYLFIQTVNLSHIFCRRHRNLDKKVHDSLVNFSVFYKAAFTQTPNWWQVLNYLIDMKNKIVQLQKWTYRNAKLLIKSMIYNLHVQGQVLYTVFLKSKTLLFIVSLFFALYCQLLILPLKNSQKIVYHY